MNDGGLNGWSTTRLITPGTARIGSKNSNHTVSHVALIPRELDVVCYDDRPLQSCSDVVDSI